MSQAAWEYRIQAVKMSSPLCTVNRASTDPHSALYWGIRSSTTKCSPNCTQVTFKILLHPNPNLSLIPPEFIHSTNKPPKTRHRQAINISSAFSISEQRFYIHWSPDTSVNISLYCKIQERITKAPPSPSLQITGCRYLLVRLWHTYWWKRPRWTHTTYPINFQLNLWHFSSSITQNFIARQSCAQADTHMEKPGMDTRLHLYGSHGCCTGCTHTYELLSSSLSLENVKIKSSLRTVKTASFPPAFEWVDASFLVCRS